MHNSTKFRRPAKDSIDAQLVYFILVASVAAQPAVVQSGSNGSVLCDSYGPRIACGGMTLALLCNPPIEIIFGPGPVICCYVLRIRFAQVCRDVVKYQADSWACWASRLCIKRYVLPCNQRP